MLLQYLLRKRTWPRWQIINILHPKFINDHKGPEKQDPRLEWLSKHACRRGQRTKEFICRES
jgi:hypothetical protein